MNTTTTSDLRQFTKREWLEAMLRFRDAPELNAAFEPLIDYWNEIAHFKYEDARDFDERWAGEEFDLDLHIGQVRYHDLFWLRETFESDTVAPVALALARLAFPRDAWEIIAGDAHAVVINESRTIVIDLIHGDRLSAEGSLALAGGSGSAAGADEAIEFLENRLLDERTRLRMVEQALGAERAIKPDLH